ncbi:MAG: hypothetical protein H7239_03725 [Flavobacterium sp.]|nr:hypothetical protein [Flavobacterium sp.]
MKTKLLLFIVLNLPLISFSQTLNCSEKESEFEKSIESKDYTKANEIWLQIKISCANFSEKNFILGTKLLNYNLQTSFKDSKINAARELIKLYDLYDKNFPNNSNGNFEKRALALIASNSVNEQEINNLLEKAFKFQQKSFSNPEALNLYFKYYFNKYKDGKSGVSFDLMMENFNEFLILLDKNSNTYPENKSEYNLVKESTTSLLSGVLSCDNLVPYVQKNFESKKENINWLTTFTNLMSENCNKNPFLETILLQLFKIKPSSIVASKLSDYYINNNENLSIKYGNDAVELESNPIEKSIFAFKIASIYVNLDTEKTNEAIKIAIKNDPKNGRYFLFLSNLYINSIPKCASTENEIKAIYVLASNTVLKAGEVESMYKNMALKLSDDYLKKANIQNSMHNKSVKIGCWINETITF